MERDGLKYIKDNVVYDTPMYFDNGVIQIELSDEQLREMGYIPLDEYVQNQGDELMGIFPDVNDLKHQIIDKMEVEYPEKFIFNLGYKWIPKIIDNKIVFELVEDQNAVGTISNPVYYIENVKLITNVYYTYDSKLYKYIGENDFAKYWDKDCMKFIEIV